MPKRNKRPKDTVVSADDLHAKLKDIMAKPGSRRAWHQVLLESGWTKMDWAKIATSQKID